MNALQYKTIDELQQMQFTLWQRLSDKGRAYAECCAEADTIEELSVPAETTTLKVWQIDAEEAADAQLWAAGYQCLWAAELGPDLGGC